jgi:hypothetical protein
VKYPRVDNRAFTVWVWIVCSALALGATFYVGIGDMTVAMAVAFHVEQEGPAFVVIYGVGLAIAVRMYPDDQPALRWRSRQAEALAAARSHSR